jgi:5-methyltetrahydrofolate--homocysteine methyltransferase
MSYEDLCNAAINGDEDKVKELTQKMLDAGNKPLDIINKGLIAGMDIVGPRFKNGEMFVPEVLMAAKAMSSGIEMVKPLMSSDDIPSIGKVVIGTVEGDLHDIGKNLVAMMLESSGFTVVNAGVDITADKFVDFAQKENADIVAMSALLTTTMVKMEETIEALKEAGIRDKVKVIIGGAPISQEFSDKIGADGYAPDAASATELCKKLLA